MIKIRLCFFTDRKKALQLTNKEQLGASIQYNTKESITWNLGTVFFFERTMNSLIGDIRL